MKITHIVGWWIQEARPEGTLTWSYHIVKIATKSGNYKLLLDIGSHPKNVDPTQISNPFENMDVNSINAVVISHVHQDHVWNCVRLVKAGYRGPIYMSEMSKYLAKIIFDDALKHEKDEVSDYNAKLDKLQHELEDAWNVVRIYNRAPETRRSKNPRQRLSRNSFSLEKLYEDKIGDILWDFAIKKTQHRRRLKEILLDKTISDDDIVWFLNQIPVHNNKSRDLFEDRVVALKREIINWQENFSGLELGDAQYKLKKFNIKSLDDIYKLDDKMAQMEFTENDVIQTLTQIVWVPFHDKIPVIANTIDMTFYKAGHVEWAVLTALEVSEWSEKKSLLFTGDLGRVKQPPLAGVPEIPQGNYDYVISEWTYAGRNHNDRLTETSKLIAELNAAKDICLIPVFALQRLQDILSMLVGAARDGSLKLGENEKIYCHSPLGYDLTKEFLVHDKKGTYANCAYGKIVKWIDTPAEWDLVVKKPWRKIIICSGWMLEQGTIAQYIDLAYNNEKALILLTWFQVPGTNWYKILKWEWVAPIHMRNKIIKENLAKIASFTFSGHADHDELMRFLTGMHYNTNAQITLVHWWPDRHILAKDLKPNLLWITVNVPEENWAPYDI